MADVTAIREDFPILGRQINGKPLVYLDNAATAQKPRAVIDCVNRLHTNLNANIHRGIHFMAEQTTAEYEAARATVARFIGAAKSREVVFTAGATASINLVANSLVHSDFANGLKPGDNVVISEMEHHANIVPWQMIAQRYGLTVRVLPFSDEGVLEVDRLPDLLDKRTKLVAITQASNVLGTNPPLDLIVRMAHDNGSLVLVDGCQGIVHSVGRLDVQSLGADFYVFSGHKIFGPTGIGVLWGREALLEQMEPFMGGGDMIATVSLTEGSTWAELPLKFEPGTANYIGAIGLGAALEYVNALEVSVLDRHTHMLNSRFAERLVDEIEGVKIFGTTPNKTPITSFTIDRIHPADIAQIVDKLGVAMRSGTHCAEPVMAHYGLTAMCRASFAMYNTETEVDMAIDAVKRAAQMLR